MKAQNKIVLILLFALLPLGMRAQEPEPQPPEDQPISPPVTLNGQGPSLSFEAEKIRSNSLSGGISLTGMYTDNVFLLSTNQVSDFSYLVQPYLVFSGSRPRVNWDLRLGAGLIVNQHLSERNQAAENLGLDLDYRLSRHVDLRLSNTFTNTTGLFSTFNPASGSGVGVVEQPNNSLVVPFARRTLANSSLAELNYQFSPSSVAGVRGTYSILDYPGSSQNAQFGPLFNSRTYSGEAFYNYRVSAKQWVGATLRAQKFETQPSIANTDTGSLLLYYGVNATPNVTLSFFAGPEYTPRISNIATTGGSFRGHLWSSAEGATFNWQGERTSVAAGFSRQLSGGGGLSSAVTLQTASARLRRQLGSRQEVEFGFAYAENDPLESGHSFHGFSGLFQFQQRLVKNLFVRVGYTREQQELPNSQSTATANLSWVSVSYDFSHPFGR